MIKLYAQPYDISATGFYFDSAEDYSNKYDNCRNDYGDQVEEFEIQFIDGDLIDAELFKALDINQATISDFFDKAEEWDTDQKIRVIIAVGECGYSFDFTNNNPEDFDLEIYEGLDSMKELAEQFVEDGIFGDIPQNLQYYIDYDAIARDLEFDYIETTVAGQNLIYRAS